MIYRTLYVDALEKTVRFPSSVCLITLIVSRRIYEGIVLAWQENVVAVIRSIKHYHYSKAYLKVEMDNIEKKDDIIKTWKYEC